MTSIKDDKIDAALARVDEIYRSGQGATGGYRVQIREVLVGLFEQGVSYGSWEPVDEPVVWPPVTSEALAGTEGGRRALRAEESHGAATEEEAVGQLRGWWEQTAHDEISGLIAKMVEYGGLSRATDLTEIGRHLTEVGVPAGPLLGNGQTQEGWLQELGIYFYLVGKFSRWSAAIQEGRPVSDDTLLDIGIYVRMAQRVRAVGGWPV